MSEKGFEDDETMNPKLTGSLLKNTRDVRVRTNHRFFHDVHPIPAFL